jgi:hypothetical protein
MMMRALNLFQPGQVPSQAVCIAAKSLERK